MTGTLHSLSHIPTEDRKLICTFLGPFMQCSCFSPPITRDHLLQMLNIRPKSCFTATSPKRLPSKQVTSTRQKNWNLILKYISHPASTLHNRQNIYCSQLGVVQQQSIQQHTFLFAKYIQGSKMLKRMVRLLKFKFCLIPGTADAFYDDIF